MHKYKLICKKGEGTFSEVIKAQSIKTGKYTAIKCMKNHFDSIEQVNNLREIQALRKLSPHQHIIKLLEVLYDEPTGRLALVFELMDMNLYEAIKGRRTYLQEVKVKNYMYQLLKAIDHMHKNGIFHRDIKPENVLLIEDNLKLADFGSCRGIFSKQPYTEYISTRWYRAPECILTDGYYNYKMDLWGVGCVFFEILSLFPLFPGNNELDQINKIHNILGTPPKELLDRFKKFSHMDFNFPQREWKGIAKYIPHVSPDCVDLIEKLIIYNPDDRITAKQALKHPYFRELREAEQKKELAMNSGPTPTLRTFKEENNNSDSASMNEGNISTVVSHNVNNININISTNNQGGLGATNAPNAGKKKTDRIIPAGAKGEYDHTGKLPTHSDDEDDGNQQLPPIKQNIYPPYDSTKFKNINKPKPGIVPPKPHVDYASLGPGKYAKGGDHGKKPYVSPYSQKAITSVKPH